MAVLAGTTSPSNPSTGLGIVAAIFLFVFNSFFAIGWLGMTWYAPSPNPTPPPSKKTAGYTPLK